MGKLWNTTKGKNPETVPLSPTAVEIVRRHIAGKNGEDWLFVNPDTGRHYPVKLAGQVWKKYSGLPLVHYEGTRHSFGTQTARAAKDIKAAQKLLRHKDERSTYKYVHADEMDYLSEITNRRSAEAAALRASAKEVAARLLHEFEKPNPLKDKDEDGGAVGLKEFFQPFGIKAYYISRILMGTPKSTLCTSGQHETS